MGSSSSAGKRIILPFLMVVLCCFSGALLTACSEEAAQVGQPPKPEVAVVVVAPQQLPVEPVFIAQVEGSHQVDIVARVSGFLEDIAYREGSLVEKDAVLFQLDRKPFQAQVDGVRAEVESRQAQLWTAKANLDRMQPLAAQNAASKSDLDNAVGTFRAAEAGLAEARARLTRAELDLGYTTIRSPITGLTGQAAVREGSYLQASGLGAPLTYVVDIDPAWITFSVSQNEFARMQSEVAQGLIVEPPDNSYRVELQLPDSTIFAHAGVLNFADPSFSKDTGTFLVRASIPNPDGLLRPGMFVNAAIKGAVRPNAKLVPQKAVQQTANGHVVYTVNGQDQVEIRPVMVGAWVGDNWVINHGVQEGDRVIVEGFQRLAPGMPVIVRLPGAAPDRAQAKEDKAMEAKAPAAAAQP